MYNSGHGMEDSGLEPAGRHEAKFLGRSRGFLQNPQKGQPARVSSAHEA